MKKIIISGVLITLLCGFCFFINNPQIEPLKLTLGHDMPVNSSIHRGSLYLKEIIEKKFSGEIIVKIYPNQTLGTDQHMVEMLAKGDLALAIPPTSKLTSLEPSFKILDIPYLLANKNKYYDFLDGDFGKKISSKLLDHGLLPVAYWESGFKQFTSTNPIHTVDDFSGLRFRVMRSETLESQAIHLHTFPVNIDFNKLKDAIEDGGVDIQENSLSSIYGKKLIGRHKNLLISNHGYISTAFLMSEKFFSKIDPQQTEEIKSLILEATHYQRIETHKDEKIILEEYAKNNVNITHSSKKFQKEFVKKLSGFYYRYRKDLLKYKHIINPYILETLKERIGIGLNLSFTYAAKDSALAIVRGAELAINNINKRGGILNKKISLDIRDHGGFPANGVSNIKDLTDDEGIISIIGGMHSPVILKESKIIKESGTPYLIPWAAASSIISNKNPYNFRISVRDEYAGEALFKKALTKGKKVYLILEDTPWGHGNFKSIKNYADKMKLSIESPYWFSWAESEFKELPNSLNKSSSDVIIYVGNSPEGIHLLKKLTQMNLHIPIVSHWGILGGLFWGKTKNDLKKLQLSFLQTFKEPTSSFKKSYLKTFLEDYRKQYKIKKNHVLPAPFATFNTYDLVMMIEKSSQLSQSAARQDIFEGLKRIKNHSGLARYYTNPFSNPDKQDALGIKDIHFATFNEHGAIVHD